MKLRKLLFGLAALAGLSIGGLAFADHFHGHGGYHGHDGFHGHVGVYLGVPFPFFPDPYYDYPYYQPVVVVPQPPPVYIEQNAPPPSSEPEGGNYYWYHCRQPEGYYPYIKACPGGWETVVPSPPPQ